MPSCRLLHLADLQVGKPFGRVADPDRRAALRLERVAVLDRVAALAREGAVDLALVAGDLFDSPSPSLADLSAAFAKLGALRIPVLAIPGNHDHGGPGTWWSEQRALEIRNQLAPNLRLLLSPEPVELDAAVILPCPLTARRTLADPTAWLRGIDPESLPAHKPRIVLAHGTVQEFGSTDLEADEDELGSGTGNRLHLDRLPMEVVDYVALGDWHGTKQVGPKAWYAGTPEIDRFPRGDTNIPGHVLRVEVQRGAIPTVTPLPTGRYRWSTHEATLDGESSLAELLARLDTQLAGRAHEDLIHLVLRGSLGIEATTRLDTWLEVLEARLVRLKLDRDLRIQPSEAEVEALTRRGDSPLIAAVASTLLAQAAAPDPVTAEPARLALRELHALVHAR